MKLLMITRKIDATDSRVGFVSNWVTKLSEQVEQLYVITWQESSVEGLPKNVTLINLPKNTLLKIPTLKLKTLQVLFKVDGVFCHMNPEYTLIVGPVARLFGKKVVSWYTHKEVTLRRRLLEVIASTIITASDKSFRKPWFPKKVKVLGHGIDVEMYRPIASRGISGAFSLLTVGRISPTKDYETMIKAMDVLQQQGGQSITLEIVGGAGLKKQETYIAALHGMVTKMNLGNVVEFAGGLPGSEVVKRLQQADVFINLSSTGSLDKAVLEAMACECVVLTSNEAFADILPTELMVEKNNPKALAEKITWVMNLTGEQREVYGKQLRQIVVKGHNLDILAKRIIDQF